LARVTFFPAGEDPLVGFGIPFNELGCREVILLKCLVKIIYRGHLDLLSVTLAQVEVMDDIYDDRK
jgi:hypothetical protein